MAAVVATRSCALKSVRSARLSKGKTAARRMVCRAEEKSVAKVERPKESMYPWAGATTSTTAYLDGSLPGDYGFDPFGLTDPEVGDTGFINASWLRYSEVIHCRFAMLGVAGCIAPEILGSAGLIPPETNLVWFKSGVIPPLGTYDKYWTDPYTLFFIEIILVQFAELKRLQDYRYPGSQSKQYFLGFEAVFKGSGDPAYPGGPFFNLFNFGKTEEEMFKYKKNEIENGRLAMISIFGYGAQAVLTRDGPWKNLLDHLADPVNNNILTNFGKIIS